RPGDPVLGGRRPVLPAGRPVRRALAPPARLSSDAPLGGHRDDAERFGPGGGAEAPRRGPSSPDRLGHAPDRLELLLGVQDGSRRGADGRSLAAAPHDHRDRHRRLHPRAPVSLDAGGKNRRGMKDRWLPFLAVALLVESAAGFTPWISEVYPRRSAVMETPRWVYCLFSSFAGLLGIVTLHHTLQNRGGVSFQSLFRVSVGFYAGTVLLESLSLVLIVCWSFSLYIPANVLTCVGSSLIWGAAMARRDHLEDLHLARFGRIGAWLTFSGFVLSFVQEVPGLIQSFRWLHSQTVGWYPLLSVFYLVSRILVLWSVIEMLRKAPDPATGRLRMRRVYRLMSGSAATMAAASLLAFGLGFVSTELSHFSLPNLWRNTVYLTMFLVT